MTRDQPPARKPPRRVTAQYLENAALHYLQRFASSSASLRRVLMRKVDRSAQAHGTDPAEGARWSRTSALRPVCSSGCSTRLKFRASRT